MFRIRRQLAWLTRLCLALFLFGQFSVAAQACVSLQASPATAFSQAEQHPCHDDGQSNSNPNACLMHCIQGDQTLDTQQQGPAAQYPVVQGFVSSFIRPVLHPSLSLRPETVAVNSSPPIPILYCRFLN
jgi:hypothetical protein